MNQPDRRGRSFLRRWLALTVLAVAIGALACESSIPSEDVIRDPSEIQALQLDTTGATLTADSVSFYAVSGQNSSVEIRFLDSLGQPGDRLLRFAVGSSSLSRYPDGSRFQPGDSVLIVIKVTDPGTLSFDFEPSGLRFSSRSPAELTVGYGRTLTSPAPIGPLSVHDGDDEDDESDLAIWMQEHVGLSYLRLNSRVDVQLSEVEADVPGFSKYAVAY